MTDIKSKIDSFNKRFNVISDKNYAEGLSKFKIRILNKFRYIDDYIEEDSIIKFCDIFGIERNLEYEENSYLGFSHCKYIYYRLNNENNEIEFYKIIQAIFYLDFFPDRGTDLKKDYYELFKEALDYSTINLEAKFLNGEVLLYPKGEKIFDESLVNETVDFLEQKSQEHFTHSLKLYQTADKKSFVKSAESLRRSLEEFLRFKLNNTKGLTANITEIQTVLKKDGRDDVIRKIIYGVFTKLDDYFNENSKHKDGDIDEAEIEYLIYQTGVLMRYINQSIKL